MPLSWLTLSFFLFFSILSFFVIFIMIDINLFSPNKKVKISPQELFW